MYGLKHQMEKRSMEHFAGLDVSVNETSVCIVDDAGRLVEQRSLFDLPMSHQGLQSCLPQRLNQ